MIRFGCGMSTLGQLRATLTGYVNDVNAIAFSPDGKTLAIANANEILLWDTETGQQRTRLSGHTESVKAITFVPDGSEVSQRKFKWNDAGVGSY